MYKITVEVLKEIDNKGYERFEDIYEQKVSELDLKAVIAVVNGDRCWNASKWDGCK